MAFRAWGNSRSRRRRGVNPVTDVGRSIRPRRSNLAVPGSSPKMLDKAKGLPADQVFMDIEDAVAPLAKPRCPQEHRGCSQRRWLRRQGSLGSSERLDHPVDLLGRHRGRCWRGCQPRLQSCSPKSKAADQVFAPWTCCSLSSRRPNGLDVGRIGIEAQIENATRVLTMVDADRRCQSPSGNDHLRAR